MIKSETQHQKFKSRSTFSSGPRIEQIDQTWEADENDQPLKRWEFRFQNQESEQYSLKTGISQKKKRSETKIFWVKRLTFQIQNLQFEKQQETHDSKQCKVSNL